MSSAFQPKRKEMAKVRVVSSDTYSRNRSSMRLVGNVHRGLSNFVTTQRNKKTGRCSYVDDTASLTRKTKNELTRFFSERDNRKRVVAYLVLPKEKKQAGSATKSKKKK